MSKLWCHQSPCEFQHRTSCATSIQSTGAWAGRRIPRMAGTATVGQGPVCCLGRPRERVFLRAEPDFFFAFLFHRMTETQSQLCLACWEKNRGKQNSLFLSLGRNIGALYRIWPCLRAENILFAPHESEDTVRLSLFRSLDPCQPGLASHSDRARAPRSTGSHSAPSPAFVRQSFFCLVLRISDNACVIIRSFPRCFLALIRRERLFVVVQRYEDTRRCT